MSLDAKIKGLNQKVSFEDGSVSNIVDIELPGGAVVVALVTEEGAQQILKDLQQSKSLFRERPVLPEPPPVVAPSAPRMVFTPKPDAQKHAAAPPPQFEFGGDGAMDELEDEDEPVVPPQYGPTLTRVRHPDADAAGNPVDKTGKPLYEEAPQQEEARVDEDGVRGL